MLYKWTSYFKSRVDEFIAYLHYQSTPWSYPSFRVLYLVFGQIIFLNPITQEQLTILLTIM